MATAPTETDVRLRVRGVVQGVGFRPFVQRTATRLGLRGWVRNDAQGVLIRAVGSEAQVEALIEALRHAAPAAAHVDSVATEAGADGAAVAPDAFAIVASETSGDGVETTVPPDLALCANCRRELLDPDDRRHRYPFINCTQCGPRYSILESLPYDRPRTTMRRFRMCARCEREYRDPADRRFHAEPNACPACGPQVSLGRESDSGGTAAIGHDAIATAGRLLADGRILAVKGVGGYHLFVNALNDSAVAELRRRKQRDEKPFAVMFRDLAALRQYAAVSATAEALLRSPAAPIVLLPRRADRPLAPSVAPGNPWIGALLAYAPLHVVLLETIDFPVVATSANLSEEPLCTDNDEAHRRLAGIADAFVDHDRAIAHPVDDSVVRVAATSTVLLRQARGYAPAALTLPGALEGHWLCVGAQMKSTVGVATQNRLVVSPHIGDLGSAPTIEVFRATIATLSALHRSEFTSVAHDKHPDYASTRYAAELGLRAVAVQHHLAHVLACLLENEQAPHDVLGVAWDGTGYGEDGTVWGGEFLWLNHGVAHRFGRLRRFRLPGGEAAIRDPRRSAVALLHETDDPKLDDFARACGVGARDVANLRTMLTRGLNSPLTSSAGRLFDAVGALLGLGRHNQFEGQTPLAVEAAAMDAPAPAAAFPIVVRDLPEGHGATCEVDWQPTIAALRERQTDGAPTASLAADFHGALAHAIVLVARRAGARTVALSGGCFQNALLLDQTVAALRAARFNVLIHRKLPPNDGNIAAGQAAAALWGLHSVNLR